MCSRFESPPSRRSCRRAQPQARRRRRTRARDARANCRGEQLETGAPTTGPSSADRRASRRRAAPQTRSERGPIISLSGASAAQTHGWSAAAHARRDRLRVAHEHAEQFTAPGARTPTRARRGSGRDDVIGVGFERLETDPLMKDPTRRRSRRAAARAPNGSIHARADSGSEAVRVHLCGRKGTSRWRLESAPQPLGGLALGGTRRLGTEQAAGSRGRAASTARRARRAPRRRRRRGNRRPRGFVVQVTLQPREPGKQRRRRRVRFLAGRASAGGDASSGTSPRTRRGGVFKVPATISPTTSPPSITARAAAETARAAASGPGRPRRSRPRRPPARLGGNGSGVRERAATRTAARRRTSPFRATYDLASRTSCMPRWSQPSVATRSASLWNASKSAAAVAPPPK